MISDFQGRIKCICNRGLPEGVCICFGGNGVRLHLPYNLDRRGLDEGDYNNQNVLDGRQMAGVLCACMCMGT